jgi:hypothetical protein
MNSIADQIPRRTCEHTVTALGSFVVVARVFFCSVHSPPITHLRGSWGEQRNLRAQWRDHALQALERPPRGVTVFAERVALIGAAGPQKRRRHFTPSHACRFIRRIPFVSTTRAPSRRLQRVSVGCTHVLRGQASRRRPGNRALYARWSRC